MTRRFLIRPEAEQDLAGAYEYYEGQYEGLGRQFLDEALATFERIREHPELYAPLYHGIRRVLFGKFPYGAFYIVDGGKIRVLAVLHMSRNPAVWRSRN